MKTTTLAAILLFALLGNAQSEAPQPKPETSHSFRNVLLANVALYGSSLIGANATGHGSHACFLESKRDTGVGFVGKLPSGENIGLVHPYRTYFHRAIWIDGGITAVSLWAHRKHHNLLAVLLPSAGAGFQLGVAGTQYAAGCF